MKTLPEQQDGPQGELLHWCRRCDRFTEQHPLVHELIKHAPAYSKGTFPARSRVAS